MLRTSPTEPFVSIVYFTDDEHRILQQYYKARPTEYGFKVYSTEIEWYEATQNVPINGPKFYLINGLRAPNGAKDFANALLRYAKPILVINIGTAGRIAHWIPLGSLVMPERITSWDDDASMTQIGNQVELLPMGKTINTGQSKSTSSQFYTRYPESYNAWSQECAELAKLVLDDLEEVGVQIETPPQITTNDLASGSIALRAEVFKAQILRSGRNICAIDMETFALVTSVEQEGIPALVIRCITDDASNDKDRTDSATSKYAGNYFSSIRLYSLCCAAALVKFTVDRHAAFSAARSKMLSSSGTCHLGDHLSERLKHRNTVELMALFPVYAGYFAAAARLPENPSLIIDLVNTICRSTDDFKVRGTPGSGKSTLVNCLYHQHLIAWKEDQTLPKPHFIDLHTYLRSNTEFQLRADVELIDESLVGNSMDVLYVDGIDSYLKDAKLQEISKDLKKYLQKRPQIRKVLAIGYMDQRYGLDVVEFKIGINARELIALSPIHQSDPQCVELVTRYCELNREFTKLSESEILHRAAVMEIKDFDLFTLSLLSNYKLDDAFDRKRASLGTVYFDFMVDGIKAICDVDSDEAESYLKVLADIVFSEQVLDAKHSVDVPDSRPTWDDNERNLRLFVHQHPSLMQFLIAEYILDNCLTTPDALGYRIYSYGVNRFLKTLANRTEKIKASLFAGILRVFENEPSKPLAQAHLAYLLGRLSLNRSNDRTAYDRLEEFLAQAISRYDELVRSKSAMRSGLSKDELSWEMLLLRTLYISLIYRGSQDHAEEYLMKLLENSEWNSLNSGFHLQYYGDLPSGTQRLNMAALDGDLGIPPLEVTNILCKSLDSYCNSGSMKPRSLIELHTLLSLHCNRHIEGHLSEGLRQQGHVAVSKFYSVFKDKLPVWYHGYIELSIQILGQSKTSGVDIVDKVLSLKNQLRSGWMFEGVRGGKEVVRVVTRTMMRMAATGPESIPGCLPESVADHSWGCCMLAWMSLSAKSEMNVMRVIQLLLIHDLAETETGDQVHEGGSNRAGQVSARLGAIGYLYSFSGVAEWSNLFRELEEESTAEAKFAKDVDKIERYMQAVKYASDEKNTVSDLKDWKPSSLLTKEGRALLDSIDRWYEIQ